MDTGITVTRFSYGKGSIAVSISLLLSRPSEHSRLYSPSFHGLTQSKAEMISIRSRSSFFSLSFSPPAIIYLAHSPSARVTTARMFNVCVMFVDRIQKRRSFQNYFYFGSHPRQLPKNQTVRKIFYHTRIWRFVKVLVFIYPGFIQF